MLGDSIVYGSHQIYGTNLNICEDEGDKFFYSVNFARSINFPLKIKFAAKNIKDF